MTIEIELKDVDEMEYDVVAHEIESINYQYFLSILNEYMFGDYGKTSKFVYKLKNTISRKNLNVVFIDSLIHNGCNKQNLYEKINKNINSKIIICIRLEGILIDHI